MSKLSIAVVLIVILRLSLMPFPAWTDLDQLSGSLPHEETVLTGYEESIPDISVPILT